MTSDTKNSRTDVDDFLRQRTLAVVGVSRSGKKFGNVIYRSLREKGYTLIPVHPAAETLEGDRCAPSLRHLPQAVGGVVLVVPPAETERIAREAHEAGIRRVWMQQGAESPAAVQFCREHGMSVISGECLLMFAEPAEWVHRAHRWVWKHLDKLPA
jgi:predicted CoA-binding protein